LEITRKKEEQKTKNMYQKNKTQLFLLHFAGGSSYSFNFLNEYLKDKFEIHSLELPGRGKRMSDKLLRNKSEAIDDYVNQIKKLRNHLPYLIYGHSMGATLSLSVVKRMEAIGDAPLKMVVSGNSGPAESKYDRKRHLLDDILFKEELKKLGGVPQEVLENEELYNFFNPIIRADFEILENDPFSEKGITINVPIYAVMGDREEMVNEIENWKNFTNEDFRFLTLQGDHFFIQKHPLKISEIIKESSKQVLVS